jgi:hypothetical protein
MISRHQDQRAFVREDVNACSTQNHEQRVEGTPTNIGCWCWCCSRGVHSTTLLNHNGLLLLLLLLWNDIHPLLDFSKLICIACIPVTLLLETFSVK